MADTKITALTALTAADPANDVIPIVDVSDTSMAASGTTKKISVNNILGASGTATLASATITGDLTVDTNVLKVDTTNNRVGIGTASPGETLDIFAAAPRIRQTATTGTNGSLLALVNTGGTAYLGLDSAGAGLTAAYALNVYHSGAYPIVFSTNATERARFNSTGNLAFASGLGIDFSAVTGGTGTATANVLNDYEEGTWQGTLTGGTTTPGSPLQATGKYTKIGRQVSITIYFQNVDTTGYAGAVSITGLPFTEDGSRAVGTAAFYNFDFNGGTGPVSDISGSTLFFITQLTNSNWRDVNHSAGAGRYLRATATYFV